MFYYIKGEIVHKGDNFVVIDAQGVGYKIYTSVSSLQFFKELNTPAKLYTHLYVREDIMDLFGFASNEELSMFLHLISVSGVGPKAALSILSVTTPAKFAVAVITNDVKTITKAQGVGPKLAQRVILELKDKLKNADALPNDMVPEAETAGTSKGEAVSALMVLGYTQNEATKAVSGIGEEAGVEDIVKQALKQLIKQGI